MVLVISVLIFFLLLWIFRKPKNFPPGPPSLPVVGSVPFLKTENFHFTMEDLRKKYGPVIGMKFGWMNVILVCGTKEVEEVLRRDEFQGRPAFLPPDKTGVMFSEGDFWSNQRRFTIRHLRDFGFGKKTVEDVILAEVWDFFRSSMFNTNKVQVSGLFNLSSVNVLWAMMGGRRFSHDEPELHRLLKSLQIMFRSGTVQGHFSDRHPILAKFLPFLKKPKELEEFEIEFRSFLQSAIKEHRQTMGEDPRDLIDVYLQELHSNKNLHSSFNEVTLLNVCSDFFSAGAESSGNSLGFAILYAILYPNWQEELYKEVVSVIGTERNPSLSDRGSLHKVEAFLSEVSRVNSIAPLTVPHKSLVETTLNGYTIPKNSMLLVSLWTIMQDKTIWGDPENFRPERFLNSEGVYVKNKGLVAFGTGKRVCPGESLAKSFIFLFFVSMIQEFQFGLPEGHPMPSTIGLSGFTLAPKPFEVSLRRRSQ